MYENENYIDYTQNYEAYQTTPVNQTATEQAPSKKKEKKRHVRAKKTALFVAAALAFGVLAGVSFCGVQMAWGMVTEQPGQDVESWAQQNQGVKPETVPELNIAQDTEIKVTPTGNPEDWNVLEAYEQVVEENVNNAMPAMVSIINNYTAIGTTFFGQTYSKEEQSSGSGIIVAESDSELLIVSNNHVVSGAEVLEVSFIDGTTAQAQIKGLDAKMDLAVISIPLEDLSAETRDAISVATLGNSDNLKLGQSVVAIGNALGYGQSVTRGSVSALNREIISEDGITGTFIQTDAAINPGNSGGALLNIRGEVIGINSNKIGGSIIEGMGYAIPINAASPIISELMLRETREKVAEKDMGYVGIYYQSVTREISEAYNMPMGVFVREVIEGGPAEKAGLVSGDIIVGFDGRDINNVEDLQETLVYYAAGEKVKLEIVRLQKGVYESVVKEVTLGHRDEVQNTP